MYNILFGFLIGYSLFATAAVIFLILVANHLGKKLDETQQDFEYDCDDDHDEYWWNNGKKPEYN